MRMRRDIMSIYCTVSNIERFEFLYEYFYNYQNILSCEKHCVIYMIENFMMKNHWEKYCKYYNSLNKNSLINRISECMSKGEAIDFVFEDAGHFVTRWSDYATKDLGHLDIVCSKGTAVDMNHWINENESIDLFDKKWQEDLKYKLHIVKRGEITRLGEYEIVAIDSKHDPRVEAMVYIISSKGKSIFYGTDMLEISGEAWKILEKHRFDVVFLDQTYGKGFNAGGHTDAGMVSDYVKTMKSKGIIDEKTLVYATHISHEGHATHEKMEKEAKSNGYKIAYDGMKLTL